MQDLIQTVNKAKSAGGMAQEVERLTHIYCSTIHNSQVLETAQMPYN
jgi:hypothetical protein